MCIKSTYCNKMAANGRHSSSNTSTNNLVPGISVLSSLPLQMMLYFNAYYSPLWVIAIILGLVLKFGYLATHYKAISIAVSLVMFLFEPTRLYLGYEGNLREKIPELAGSWFLTIFQLLLAVYLMANSNTIVLPIEVAATVPLLGLLLVEVVFGFRALQVMIREQPLKFHLRQVESSPQQPPPSSHEEDEEIELEEIEHGHLHQD